MSKWETNEEIQLFREYLRINTSPPNIDYKPCVAFLEKQANDLNLTFAVHYPSNIDNPVCVMTWTGSEPNLPSILLNSHMDVVPVFADRWTHPPFAAEIDESGKIYARGAQDMKCVGMQYLAAIRAFKRNGIQRFKRTIYLTFVADEELGGVHGMDPFVKTDIFKSMNVGTALDEGIASPTEDFNVYYGERTVWKIEFKCFGQSGHGSLLLKNTPGEKITYLLDKLMSFRRTQEQLLENNPELTIGDVTTVNVTILSGGVQENVVPPVFNAIVDIRLSNDIDHKEFEEEINRWCEEAGGEIEVKFSYKSPKAPLTAVDDTNPFWLAFKGVADELNLKIKTLIFPGGTDSRFVRRMNIPALGFSPMNNTPVLLHDHDEFLQADVYLNGIEIYKKIIPALANV